MCQPVAAEPEIKKTTITALEVGGQKVTIDQSRPDGDFITGPKIISNLTPSEARHLGQLLISASMIAEAK